LQVKTVCTWIGAQAWIDTEKTGGRNPLVDLAQQLDFTGGRDEAEEELDRIRGPKVADRIEDDPRFAPVAADPDKGVEASNPEGSFEAMIRMLGGGMGPPAVPGIEQAQGADGGEPAGQL
jgi:hypothetical protein